MENGFLHAGPVRGHVHVDLGREIGIQVIALHGLGGDGRHARATFLGEAVEHVAGFIHVLDSDGHGVDFAHIVEGYFLCICPVGGHVHVDLSREIGIQIIALHGLGGDGRHTRAAFLGEAAEHVAGLIHVLDGDGHRADGPRITEFHPGGIGAVGVHVDLHLGRPIRDQGQALKRGRIDDGRPRLVGFLGAVDHVARVVQTHHLHRGGLHRRAEMELHGIGGAAAVGVHGDVDIALAHALIARNHGGIGADPAVIRIHRDGGLVDHLAGHGVDVAHRHGGFRDLRDLGHGLLAGQGGRFRLGGDVQPQGGRLLAQGVKGHDLQGVHARFRARVHKAQLGQGQALRGQLHAGHQGKMAVLARHIRDGQPGVRHDRLLGRVEPKAVFIAGGQDGAGRAEAGLVVPHQADGDRQHGRFGLGRQAAQGPKGQQGGERQRSQSPDQVSFQSHFHKRLLGRKITK